MTVQVELVSPERILFSGEADMVICRTVGGGDIAFLEGHAPFMGALQVHPVTIRRSGEDDEQAAVHGGFVHVKDNKVIVLSDVAELASQIDADRARRTKEWAEGHERDEHSAEVEATLRRAHVRLELAEG